MVWLPMTIWARPTSLVGSSVVSCRVLYRKLKMLLAPTRSPTRTAMVFRERARPFHSGTSLLSP